MYRNWQDINSKIHMKTLLIGRYKEPSISEEMLLQISSLIFKRLFY